MKHKKLIAIDFDGVLHSYVSGWRGARNVPDPPVPGAIPWLELLLSEYADTPDSMCAMAPPGRITVAIFSSRSRYFGGRSAMKRWLVKHGLDKRWLEVIKFPLFKPPSHVLLDDRAVTFNGGFPSGLELINFRPWWKPVR